MRDYLNPERIYTRGEPFDEYGVGVSKTENTTVKDSLTAEDEDEVVYATGQKGLQVRETQYLDIDENGMVTGVCSSRDSKAAAGGENAERAEKSRDDAKSATTANGQQVKNGTGAEGITSDTRNLQVGTAEECPEVALDWFRYELTALRLWAKDSWLVEPLTLYRHEDAEAIAEYFQAAIDALAKTGSETGPNHGTEPRQSAECAWCGPVPDPSTGLLPCGCGGVAKLYHYDEEDALLDGFPDDEWWNVYCDDCGMGTGNEETDGKAIAAWNLAMGYRG